MVDECLAPFVYLHTCVYSCFLMCVCVCAIFVCVCYICVYVCVCVKNTCHMWGERCYGVATISRLLEFMGLFCKRGL